MSVSHNMLALFSSVPRSGNTLPGLLEPAPAGSSEGLSPFAEVLSGQQSDQLDAFLALLGQAEGEGDLALMEQMQVAADGKELPEGMQGLVEDWAQWLTQARQALEQPGTQAPVAQADEVEVDSAMSPAQALVSPLSMLPETRATVAAGPQQVTAIASQGGMTTDQLQLSQLERDARQELPPGSSRADRTNMLDAQLQLRPQDASVAGAETRAAFTAKLTDALESLSGKSAVAEPEALEALQRPGAPGQAAAQGALSARPVLAASQALGVPFGQAGWGDALVDKMQWMSSQNLRSVEIRLDPAELGPLEIHIQTRGLEHQVQFVSQNPSVREALEAQMFRLRESFSQQGLDLVDVSVGDSAVGQQAREDSDGRSGGRGEAIASGSGGVDEPGMLQAAEAASQAMSSRLIDYYA